MVWIFTIRIRMEGQLHMDSNKGHKTKGKHASHENLQPSKFLNEYLRDDDRYIEATTDKLDGKYGLFFEICDQS